MILFEAPSFTKYVPMIEVMTQAPPIAKGRTMPASFISAGNAIAASTMVATVVTT